MRFSCILAIVLLLAITEPGRAIQDADIWCYWNQTTGILWAELTIFKNDSNANVANLLEDLGNNEFETLDQSGCQWSGDGSDLDPWTKTVRYDFANDQPVAGVDPCGAQPITVNEEYFWTVHSAIESMLTVNEEYFWTVHSAIESMIFQEGDVLFLFTCNISSRLPDVLTWQGSMQWYDVNKDIVPGDGLIKLRAFAGNTLNNQLPINTIEIGDYFQLQLSFQPDGISRPETDENLAPWGAYCNTLYAEPPNKLRRVYMLDNNGCPRNDEPFLRPAYGFNGTQPDRNNQFTSMTGVIEAARFDKIQTTSIVFVCEAKLCWIDGDGLCIDMCDKRTNGRRKRSMVRRVSTTIYLTEGADEFDKEEQKSDDEDVAVYVWAIIGGGAFVALVIIVVCCVLLARGLRRRNRKYQHQHNSSSASANSTYDRKY